jgi:hypothetical protein
MLLANVRKGMGLHHIYASARNALELLEAVAAAPSHDVPAPASPAHREERRCYAHESNASLCKKIAGKQSGREGVRVYLFCVSLRLFLLPLQVWI